MSEKHRAIISEDVDSITFELEQGLFLQCCDCGLVHTVLRKIEGDKVIVKFMRNEGRTEAARSKVRTLSQRLDDAIRKEMGNPISFSRNRYKGTE